MTNFEVVRDLVLLMLALLGSGLSIYNFIDARNRNKRSLRVSMVTSIPTYVDGSLGQPFAQVQVTNVGHRDVTVTSIGIEIPGGGHLVSFEREPFPTNQTSLPTTLRDGEQACKHWSYEGIGKALLENQGLDKVQITPFAKDSTGIVHKGESWEVDPSEFAHITSPR